MGNTGDDSNGIGVNPSFNNLATNSGAAYIYTRSGSTWSNGFYLKASDTNTNDLFGSVSISKDGNTIAVGAYGEASSSSCINGTDDNIGTESGAVYLFNKVGANWISTFKIQRPSGMLSADTLRFGFDVVLDATGNTICIAAPYEDSSSTGINGAYNTSASASGAVVTYTKN